ncbi:MAG TPA: glucose 1-dehydrogenase [Gemmataceae bacterium]|jgi:NAD(P)-dependent dehydrogenase (short-subunit alcohol dehydrogenase family)
MPTARDAFDLTGRRALVTGASRGIGFAVAEALAQRGASVAITGRKADNLNAAAQQIHAAGADVRPFVCHQGDPAAIKNLFEQLDAAGFTADIVVINAATNPVLSPLVNLDLDAWRKIIEVNLTGALLTAQAAARRLLPLRRGSIVFMASIAGIDPMLGLGAYSVSKAGVLGLMRALAKELGPSGIRVNAVAPGLIETRFAAALFQDRTAYERIIGQTPLGRHGQPEDVCGAVVFLASEAAAYVNGQVLIVDGGGRVG